MATIVKGSYLRVLAIYAHIYAFLIVTGWLASLYGLISFPLPIITVFLAVLPSLYYMFVYRVISAQFGRRVGYAIGVIVLVTPMLVIFLTTSGFISVNNLALAVMVFLSAALGPSMPIALIWMLTVGYILALSGYIPSLGNSLLGTLLLALYVLAGLFGWAVFRRYYIREDIEVEALRKTLRAEQVQSENVIAAISDGVAIVDGKGTVKHANQKFLDMIALEHDELVGRHYSDVVSSRIHITSSSSATPRIGQNIQHVFEAGEPVEIDSITAEYVDGSGIIDFSISISPLRNDDGEMTAVLIMARDISSIMKLQRMKDALISTASHELRTPITVIAGYADLLLGDAGGGKLTEKQRHYVERTKETTAHLTEMINDMLDMSRLESGQREDKPAALNIQNLLNEVVESQLSLFANKQLALHLDADPVRVYADSSRLKEVVTHLLSNAFKFTPEDGKVTIMAKAVEGACEVAIIDTGPGVPEEHLQDIFDKFSKLDDTGSQPGTGLGLAIAKNIVDNWGGKIAVENNPDGGARFYFTVPLTEEQAKEEGGKKHHENSDHRR
jgi:PAS domain S-box-containing protein